jgi:three-Cys-motif partner protein
MRNGVETDGHRPAPKRNTWTGYLFPNCEREGVAKRPLELKRLEYPVWTEHKAHFIERYLFNFVQVTKHGTYIDGFAGPQRIERPDAWTAKLVLASRPAMLRNFHLCELDQKKVLLLRKLKAEQPARDSRNRKLSRIIEIYPGDFNAEVNRVLANAAIDEDEPTFCLLDQRTFECHWETVVKLAKHKGRAKHKIELLYFLGVGWIYRALSAVSPAKAKKWWGAPDWQCVRKMPYLELCEAFVKRFRNELGYEYAMPYAIYNRKGSRKIMYYMIHASDHREAPKLMVRAYNAAVRSVRKKVEQQKFGWD